MIRAVDALSIAARTAVLDHYIAAKRRHLAEKVEAMRNNDPELAERHDKAAKLAGDAYSRELNNPPKGHA